MIPPGSTKQAFAFPKLKVRHKTPVQTDRFVFYDIKFYPFQEPFDDDEPVFAIISPKTIQIGRVSLQAKSTVTMIHEMIDKQEENDAKSLGLNSCSWCYIDPSEPLLVVAGNSGQLKVIDVVAGKIIGSLTGHGYGTINDIATHPIYPWIIATASMDRSVRIWDLRRQGSRYQSPTIIICGQSTGHMEGVLTLTWHATGRYLLTGGHDHRICVWTIPDLDDDSTFWHDISPAHRKRSSHEVLTIHYPHFVTSAIHGNFVDCVRFWGDLIISKASDEHKIVLWKITGFDSRQEPPSAHTAPKTEEHFNTRNGFIRRAVGDQDGGVVTIEVAKHFEHAELYDRLLTFDNPKSEHFYMRFGLLSPSPLHPHVHTMLAAASNLSELRFWDLDRMSLGRAGDEDNHPGHAPKRKFGKGIARPVKGQDRASRLSGTPLEKESSMSATTKDSSPAWPRQSSTEATSEISDRASPFPMPRKDRDKYPVHDPTILQKAHAKHSLIDLQFKSQAFSGRSVDWSPCGQWCIVVGESQGEQGGIGAYAVFHRTLTPG